MIPAPYPYIHLLGKDIPWYGILFIVGLGIGGLASSFRSKRRKIDRFDSICCAVYAGVGGIIGAKVFSWMTGLDIIVEIFQKIDPLTAAVAVFQNGFVFYGGLIGGFIGLILYCREFKLPTIDFLDVFAVSVPLGHVFGRIGCFISGCCYGHAHDGFLSVIYTNPIDTQTPTGTPILAVQLIEAFSLLILYIILEICFYKTKKKGLCTCFYIIGYSAIRFTLEYFRGDPARGFLLGMTTSQLISVLLVLTMVVVLCYNWFKNKYEKEKIGFTDAVTSTVIGSIGFVLSVLLLVLSMVHLKAGQLGPNSVYCVGLASLLGLTLSKGLGRLKECLRRKKVNENYNKNTLLYSALGCGVSAIGLLITAVSVALLIVGIVTF